MRRNVTHASDEISRVGGMVNEPSSTFDSKQINNVA
jgi:hypothetical protein